MTVTVGSCCNEMDALTKTQQITASKMLIPMILKWRFPYFSKECKQSSIPYFRPLAYYTKQFILHCTSGIALLCLM